VQDAASRTTPPSGGAVAASPELKHDALGFVGSLLIGIASVAPAYSFAAILGLLVATAGLQAPAVVIVSFIPMLFVASAYYWMNRADPDCGTTFAWATRALGPTTGWLAGWSILTAGVIVIGLLANTAAFYTFDLLGADSARDSKWVVIALATVMIIGATYITVRGIELSARLQYILMALQIGGLLLFALVALWRVVLGDGGPTSVDPSISWFSPFAVDGTSVLIAGVLLGVFAVMIPVALVVYGIAVARTYFDSDEADAVLARERAERGELEAATPRADPRAFAAPIGKSSDGLGDRAALQLLAREQHALLEVAAAF